MLLVFVDLFWFYLATESPKENLTIGLAIGNMELIRGEVAVNFSGYSL